MNLPVELITQKAVDSIQQRLTDYACRLTYEDLTAEAIHAAKLRLIDTLGALIGGFFTEPCQKARDLAAAMGSSDGATLLGTRIKTTPAILAVKFSQARCDATRAADKIAHLLIGGMHENVAGNCEHLPAGNLQRFDRNGAEFSDQAHTNGYRGRRRTK